MKKLRNTHHYNTALQSYSLRSSVLPPSVGIETSSICNLKCSKCVVGQERKPTLPFMPMSLFKRLIKQIRPFSTSVNLSYFGEPFGNPEIFKMIAFAKKAGLKTSLYTNGLLITPAMLREISQSGLDSILISLDGFDPTFFSRMKNITIGKAKLEIPDLQRRAIQLSRFTRVTVVHMAHPDNTPFSEYCEYWRGTEVTPVSGGLVDWGLARIESTRERGKFVCRYPWEMSITTGGKVPLCHFDFNNETLLGDATTTELREIYNGEKAQEMRKRQVECDLVGLPCVLCRYVDFGIKRQSAWLQTAKEAVKRLVR